LFQFEDKDVAVLRFHKPLPVEQFQHFLNFTPRRDLTAVQPTISINSKLPVFSFSLSGMSIVDAAAYIKKKEKI